jgi:CRISPR-associated endonuclease/helicase Cas3
MILSHPNRKLINHLENTFKIANEIYNNIFLKNSIYNLTKEEIREIIKIIIFYHDLGKATSYFQDYLKEEPKNQKKLKSNPLYHHSLISSIFAYFATKKYLDQYKPSIDDDIKKLISYISFIVIKKHHSYLQNLRDIISINYEQDKEILQKQFISIRENIEKYKDEFKKIPFLFDIVKNVEEVIEKEKNFIKYFRSSLLSEYKIKDVIEKNNFREEEYLGFYIISLLFYSILTYSDRLEASIKGNIDILDIFYFKNEFPDYYIIEKYINKITKNDNSIFGDKINLNINSLRKKLFTYIKENIDNVDFNDNLFLMNLPTGLGKTLLNFYFSINLKKKIKENYNYDPKIIYCLPFISIIDQVDHILRNIFNLNKIQSYLYLSNHYLSSREYSLNLLDVNNYDKSEFIEEEKIREYILVSELLSENWNSHIVLTTFVRFFESFSDNQISSIMRFHNLVSSIIILDEIQNIPHKYYKFLDKIFKALAYYFNTYFILSTATAPIFLDNYKSILDNLDVTKEFKLLNRVNISVKINSENNNIKDLANYIQEIINKESVKKLLVVLNTIGSAKELYKNLINKLENKNVKLYFLSSHVVPKERLRRIKEIKNYKDNEVLIVISTQIIEAGVDLDFDYSIRDLAPLDSIIQVAGRTNRNYTKNTSTLDVFLLKNDISKFYCYYIYDQIILENTKDILLKNQSIPESNFSYIFEQYKNKLKQAINNEISNRILNNIVYLNFENVSYNKLIEKNYKEYSIFVELDSEAKKIWEKYTTILNSKKYHNYLQIKQELIKIKNDLFSYVINVSKTYSEKNLPPKVNNFLYISYEDLNKYYDLETGFIPENNDLLIF